MLKDALYYPHIGLSNPAFVKSLAFFMNACIVSFPTMLFRTIIKIFRLCLKKG